MRFHVVGLPHTKTSLEYSACAFTIKVLRFCSMMKSLGHIVFHYGAEGSEVDCDEHINIISHEEQLSFFGPHNPNVLYSADWSGKAPYWQLTNERAVAEINKRKQRGDFVCVCMGTLNIPLAQLVNDGVLVVEPFIGYNGTFAKYRVFESYAHLHKIWGAQGGFDPDGRFYDAVIPNYLNPIEFPFDPYAVRGDYYLYIGRLIQRKGVNIAVETCKQLGAKLILAGQGVIKIEEGKIHCSDGGVYEGDLKYVGCVNGEQRAKLYQNAIATFLPTIYIEPFGTVNIESQMAGTPVITTDFGAFPETVQNGKTGFRCHSLDHFIFAAKHAHELDRRYIHNYAVANYSMDRVRLMFNEYFEMLSNLWGAGWNTLNPNRKEMNWLTRY